MSASRNRVNSAYEQQNALPDHELHLAGKTGCSSSVAKRLFCRPDETDQNIAGAGDRARTGTGETPTGF